VLAVLVMLKMLRAVQTLVMIQFFLLLLRQEVEEEEREMPRKLVAPAVLVVGVFTIMLVVLGIPPLLHQVKVTLVALLAQLVGLVVEEGLPLPLRIMV
jgi:hypothetical protein